jgi:hypothetical protein
MGTISLSETACGIFRKRMEVAMGQNSNGNGQKTTWFPEL